MRTSHKSLLSKFCKENDSLEFPAFVLLYMLLLVFEEASALGGFVRSHLSPLLSQCLILRFSTLIQGASCGLAQAITH